MVHIGVSVSVCARIASEKDGIMRKVIFDCAHCDEPSERLNEATPICPTCELQICPSCQPTDCPEFDSQ